MNPANKRSLDASDACSIFDRGSALFDVGVTGTGGTYGGGPDLGGYASLRRTGKVGAAGVAASGSTVQENTRLARREAAARAQMRVVYGIGFGLIMLLLLALSGPAFSQGYVPTEIPYSDVENIAQAAAVDVVTETDYFAVVVAALTWVLPTALGVRLFSNAFRLASEKQ